MRNKFLKSVAAGLSLALIVTSVNLPVKTASAAKKYRVVEKAVLSAAKKTKLWDDLFSCLFYLPASVFCGGLA